MGFIAKNGGGDFRQVPPGLYEARCFSLIDLGTQTSEKFGTAAHKIKITWEVFGDDEDGQPLVIFKDGKKLPMTVSAEYTVSLNEKANLRKVLESWRGKAFTPDEAKGFDISKLIGTYCMVNITSSTSANGKTYSNVAGVSQMQRGKEKPAAVHQNVLFSLDDPDMSIFDTFHEKLQDRIRSAPEWSKRNQKATAGTAEELEEDDVPFISCAMQYDMESSHQRRMRRYF